MSFTICSDFVWYDKILDFVVIVLIGYLTYTMINFIHKAITVKFDKKKLLNIFILSIIVFVISLYINNKYFIKIDYDNINQFGLCTDECIYIDLESTEEQELLNEFSTYDFEFDKNHMKGDLTILINDEIIQYRYVDLSEFRDDELHYFVLRDEGKYYSFEVHEENNLVKIINKYQGQYEEIQFKK